MPFTWSNGHKDNTIIFERLDRAIAKKKELIRDLDRIQQDIMSMPDSSSLLNNETSIKKSIKSSSDK